MFSVKSQRVKPLDLASHIVCHNLSTLSLLCKSSMDLQSVHGHGCAPGQLYKTGGATFRLRAMVDWPLAKYAKHKCPMLVIGMLVKENTESELGDMFCRWSCGWVFSPFLGTRCCLRSPQLKTNGNFIRHLGNIKFFQPYHLVTSFKIIVLKKKIIVLFCWSILLIVPIETF